MKCKFDMPNPFTVSETVYLNERLYLNGILHPAVFYECPSYAGIIDWVLIQAMTGTIAIHAIIVTS